MQEPLNTIDWGHGGSEAVDAQLEMSELGLRTRRWLSWGNSPLGAAIRQELCWQWISKPGPAHKPIGLLVIETGEAGAEFVNTTANTYLVTKQIWQRSPLKRGNFPFENEHNSNDFIQGLGSCV